MASSKEIAWRTGLAITVATGSVGVPAIIEQQKGGLSPSTQALNEFLKSPGLSLDIPSLKKAEAAETQLTKEYLKEELFTLVRGAEKYTLNDGSGRIQYPNEAPSEFGWSRHAESSGELMGYSGQINVGGLDLTKHFIYAHEDVRRFKEPINVIEAYFLLRGVEAATRDPNNPAGRILLEKLNQIRVDENGGFSENGQLSMGQFWAQKIINLLKSGDFKGNHASFSLADKVILSRLSKQSPHIFGEVPSLSSWEWGGKDVQALRDCYRGEGVFEDLADGQGHQDDLYTDVIMANIDFLSTYFQRELSEARINWFLDDEIRNMTFPYLDRRIRMANKEGVIAYDGRGNFSYAPNPPIFSSLLSLSSKYRFDLVPRAKALLKQSLLTIKQNALKGDYVLPKLTEEATAFDGSNRIVTSTSNMTATLGRVLLLPDYVVNIPEQNPLTFSDGIYFSGSEKLMAGTPKGEVLTINFGSYDLPKDGRFDPRYLVPLKHPDFLTEGEAWAGERPIIYGALAIRYEGNGAVPFNLTYFNKPEFSNMGWIDYGQIAWAFRRGRFWEFADGLGKTGRETNVFLKQFSLVSFDPDKNIHVTTLSKVSAPEGARIVGINDTSLPLPGNPNNNDFKIEYQSGGAMMVNSRGRFIFGRSLFGLPIQNPLYLFPGGRDDLQKNPFAPSNRAISFGAIPNQKEAVVVSDWVYKKGERINPDTATEFIKLLSASPAKVVLKIGGVITVANFDQELAYP